MAHFLKRDGVLLGSGSIGLDASDLCHRAMLHLLDSCIYTKGMTTFVDFFPFYNATGKGSELNILKVSRTKGWHNDRNIGLELGLG